MRNSRAAPGGVLAGWGGEGPVGLCPHNWTSVPCGTGSYAARSLGLSEACIPSRSASRVLAPVTVTVAAWTDEEARVRAALACWRSWREKREDPQGETLDGQGLCLSFSCSPQIPGHPQGSPTRCLLQGHEPTCVRGSVFRSSAWAVAWRARAASVTARSLEATVFSRACAFRPRAPAWDFCREMVGSGRARQEDPRGKSSTGWEAPRDRNGGGGNRADCGPQEEEGQPGQGEPVPGSSPTND